MVQNVARDCLLDEAAVGNVETLTLDRVGGNDDGKRNDDCAERCSNGRGTGHRCQHTELVFYGRFLCTLREATRASGGMSATLLLCVAECLDALYQ